MGIFYPGKYLKDHKEPLLILLNERRAKRWLSHVLPHELCHLIGFLCKRYNAEPGCENAAYTMGYLMEEFSAVLTEHMKTIPVAPEPKKVEISGEPVEFATRD